MSSGRKSPRRTADCIEVCILAGGRSTRMGRDKARLRLGGRSLTGLIRAAARGAGLPVRVLRRDLVPRCGPLGGVFTALTTTHAEAVLFLSCDMPFVSPALLRRLVTKFSRRTTALFTVEKADAAAGFPFLVRREAWPQVEKLLGQKQFSLQHFSRAVMARRLRPPTAWCGQLLNVNTPADWALARRRWRQVQAGK